MLLLGSKDEGYEYAKGLFAASLIIAIFIIFWFIFLCVFTCLGPKRVGLLSGRLLQPQQGQSNPSNDNRNDNLDYDRVHLPAAAQVYDNKDTTGELYSSQTPQVSPRQKRILIFSRVMVLFCSLGIVVCSILMVTKGVDSLVSASDSALEGMDKAQDLANEAVDLIDRFVEVADSATGASRTFVSELNTGFCPTVREELCTNLESAWADAREVGVNLEDLPDVECDFSGIPYEEEVEALLNTRTTKLKDELYKSRADIVEVSEMLGTARDNAGESSTFGLFTIC